MCLIGVGGLVTSHGAGLAVPDWPTTYGYNMFLFPISKWVGGIFYEHTHRLVAAGVGLLTTLLAVWLWLKDCRVWLRRLGLIAFFGVVLQGVLGGLRVVLFKDQIGIFHAALAQLFLVVVSAIALLTSPWWQRFVAAAHQFTVPRALRRLFLITTAVILAQLVIGATMRHQHAGLSIPDFPRAYGRLWPDTSAAAVARYNQQRMEITAANPITAFQIDLQMVHRLLAAAILGLVAVSAWGARRRLGWRNPATKMAAAWLGLVCAQAALGAWTIWSHKAADIATAHVVVGAVSLVTGALLSLVAFRSAGVVAGWGAESPATEPAGARSFDGSGPRERGTLAVHGLQAQTRSGSPRGANDALGPVSSNRERGGSPHLHAGMPARP